MNRPRFSELLLEAKLATEDQIRQALAIQAKSGGLMGSILFEQGVLTEQQVVAVLSKVYEIPAIVISQFTPDPALQKKIPEEIAQKYQLLPLKLEDKVLTVAVSNPLDLKMIQEVEFMTGFRLRVCIAMQTALRDRIGFFYKYSQQKPIEIAFDKNEISLSPWTSPDAPMSVTAVADGSAIEDLKTKDLRQAQQLAKSRLPTPPPIDWHDVKQRKSTILVVDDDATIRTLLYDAFQAKGYNVVLAASGREGVQKIQNIRPDLIILDAMLPEIHGFTICKTLKDSQKYRNIPVMIITAVYTGWRFMMDVKENYGANEVMEKPFKIQEMMANVKKLLDESVTSPEDMAHKDVELSRKAEDCLQEGMKIFAAGKVQEAMAHFKRGIEIDQFHPMLHYYMGKCHESFKDPFKAMACMEQAIAIDSHLFPAVKDIAILYQQNGFKRKAIEMWERAIQMCADPALKEKIKQNLIKML